MTVKIPVILVSVDWKNYRVVVADNGSKCTLSRKQGSLLRCQAVKAYGTLLAKLLIETKHLNTQQELRFVIFKENQQPP